MRYQFLYYFPTASGATYGIASEAHAWVVHNRHVSKHWTSVLQFHRTGHGYTVQTRVGDENQEQHRTEILQVEFRHVSDSIKKNEHF